MNPITNLNLFYSHTQTRDNIYLTWWIVYGDIATDTNITDFDEVNYLIINLRNEEN
jgi:hypothetical protein